MFAFVFIALNILLGLALFFWGRVKKFSEETYVNAALLILILSFGIAGYVHFAFQE